MSQDYADHIPVREGDPSADHVNNSISGNKPERLSKIQQALSNFRSGVEKVYSESRERSLGRLKDSEDEMHRKFSIQKVINNDMGELQNLGQDNLSHFLSDEHNDVLQEATKLDCYVIREQVKSSVNREEEEERIYREQIQKLHRKNQELEQQIQQKKRMQKLNSHSSSISSVVKSTVDNVPKNITPVALPFPSIEQKMQQFDLGAFNNFQQPPNYQGSFNAGATQNQKQQQSTINKTSTTTTTVRNQKNYNKSIQEQIDDIPLPGTQIVQEENPDIQVVYEGEKRDLNKCLRKFAKKIFYLQRLVQDLTGERDKYKIQFELSEASHKEYRLKYEEIREHIKLQERQGSEARVELEKYKTMAVTLEEELNKLRFQQHSSDPEVQIVEKLIEKPIEIIKHVVLEKIIEKPIEIIKTIEAPPIEIEKIIERVVEVPVERIVEKVVHVPYETIIEKVVEVPKIEIVEREKIIEIPRPEYIEKIVHVDKPVYIDRPQIVKEIIETKDNSYEKELHLVRDDYRRLQQINDQSARELEEWRMKCIRLEDQYRNTDADRSIVIERDRTVLLDEIKNSHQTIDNLRDRIEMLYKEITVLTDNNNRKNVEMTNQIHFLEEQLALNAPRIISTSSYSGLPAYQPIPPPVIPESTTVYYKSSNPVYSHQAYTSTGQQPNNQFNNSQTYQQTFQQNSISDNQPINNSRYQL